MWLCHISGTETEGQGVWASLTGPESAGAGAGGADGQFVRGQHWSYDMSLRICLWGKLCWIAQTSDKIYSSRNCHWLAVLYRQLESTQLDVVKGSSLQIFANKSKSCWHRKKSLDSSPLLCIIYFPQTHGSKWYRHHGKFRVCLNVYTTQMFTSYFSPSLSQVWSLWGPI